MGDEKSGELEALFKILEMRNRTFVVKNSSNFLRKTEKVVNWRHFSRKHYCGVETEVEGCRIVKICTMLIS